MKNLKLLSLSTTLKVENPACLYSEQSFEVSKVNQKTVSLTNGDKVKIEDLRQVKNNSKGDQIDFEMWVCVEEHCEYAANCELRDELATFLHGETASAEDATEADNERSAKIQKFLDTLYKNRPPRSLMPHEQEGYVESDPSAIHEVQLEENK